MDLDGRLSCDEFVLAMHLCDIAKAGEKIPNALPIELIPPAFRRQRQSSLTLSQSGSETVDPLAGMPQVIAIFIISACVLNIIFYDIIFPYSPRSRTSVKKTLRRGRRS